MPKLLSDMFSRHKDPTPEDLEGAVKQIKVLQQVDLERQGYYDRLQRASSWLAKAKRTNGDSEGKFIFLWIALNALCGVREDVFNSAWWKRNDNLPPSLSKRDSEERNPGELEWFLWRVCGLDLGQGILKRVIEAYQDDIKMILRTEYLMPNYWSWKWRIKENIDEWKKLSRAAIERAISTSGNREATYRALGEILVWRLRTLRNQLFHGCATDTHSKRRATGESELEAGSRLLEELIWAFLVLMAGESGRIRYWPPSPYPRAGSPQHERFKDSWLPK